MSYYEIKSQGIEASDEHEKPKSVRIIIDHVVGYQENNRVDLPTRVYATNGVWDIDVPFEKVSKLIYNHYNKNGKERKQEA
jgi:hypothetical protein